MLRWDTLSADVVPQWTTLTNLLAEYDDTGETYSAEDLAEEFTEHGFEARTDSWTVWDDETGNDTDDETLVACGQLRVSGALMAAGTARATLGGGVHPQWRGRGIGSQLLERMEERAMALAGARHPGAPVQLRPSSTKDSSDAARLFGRLGYRPARWFTEMRRPLPGAPLPVADPRAIPLTPELGEAVRVAHNDAFATHWGSSPQTRPTWDDFLGSRSQRPAISRLIPDVDGTVLTYALVEEWVDRECYFGLIGTVQRARGQGLARAVLLASLDAAVRSGGYDMASLGVDAANPTGAGRLYESVGFTPVRTLTAFDKVLE